MVYGSEVGIGEEAEGEVDLVLVKMIMILAEPVVGGHSSNKFDLTGCLIVLLFGLLVRGVTLVGLLGLFPKKLANKLEVWGTNV
jgi:hypothetical protein